jgi:hypothetical protein
MKRRADGQKIDIVCPEKKNILVEAEGCTVALNATGSDSIDMFVSNNALYVKIAKSSEIDENRPTKYWQIAGVFIGVLSITIHFLLRVF